MWMAFLLSLFLLLPANGANLAAVQALCPLQKAKAFDPDFLKKNGADFLENLFAENELYYGPCQEVRPLKGGFYLLRYKEATVRTELAFTAKGQIKKLLFDDPEFIDDNWQKLQAFALRVFPKISFTASSEGQEVFSVAPDQPLNISRSFTAFILQALRAKITAGSMKPEQILRLQGENQLVSFGMLSTWPGDSLFTVDSLKNIMLIENDATAADLLLRHIGKEEVQKFAQAREPLLSHREHALLMQEKKVDANSLAKRLAELNKNTGAVPFPPERFDLVETVGWFASTRNLCRAVYAARDEVSVSLPSKEFRAAHGLERAVVYQPRDSGIAQSTLLLRKKGHWHCFSATVNHRGVVNEFAFSQVVRRGQNLLSR